MQVHPGTVFMRVLIIKIRRRKMNKIDELSKAIETLVNECQSHERCKECPFWDETKSIGCNFYSEPYTWRKLKEKNNEID